MPYIIDGHNLIPKIPGLALDAVDDEAQLIVLLQDYCRLARKEAEVFFDNAPAGQPRARNFGLVIARFIRQGTTADEAIRRRLGRLEREARNWTVVSSDLEVQAAARAARAHFISSEAFAAQIRQTLDESAADEGERPEAEVNSEELDDWLKLFGAEGEK